MEYAHIWIYVFVCIYNIYICIYIHRYMAYLPRQLADLTGDFPVWNRARPGAERPEALSAEM